MFSIDPRTGRKLVGRFTFNRANDGEGGSNDGGAGTGEAARSLQNLLAKRNNDAVALAADLLAENAKYREKNRELAAERDALKAKVPIEGAVILTGDDAKLFTELTAKVPLKDAKSKLDEAARTASELATERRTRTVRTAADAHGFKPSVLEKLVKDDGLEFTLKAEGGELDLAEVDREGKKVRVATVKGADGKAVPLDEYASQHWQDFLPALTAQGGSQSNGQDKKQAVYAGPGTRDAKPPTPEELAAQKRATGEYTI